ncbi:hypothetical protein [Aeromicrobium choanae]|uniref:DUF4350 domain-containing protein n=1 Tax=Aeromicrobium choanae TaxID=1736691 RepID=A0A1T4YTN4_9ACTN|nr:hypothetical protein [Aeromicrobium choanae]SKB05100.1 hypothetical protein SAMN06295964_0831 [Aeromicrobium choanae]
MTSPKNQYRVLSGLLTGALVTGALAFAAPVATAAPVPPKPGAKIALLNDPSFVDTIDLADVAENESHEAANMIVGLRADGHTVTPFTGTSAAAVSSALKGQDTLVVPELEQGAWVPALEPAAKSAIVSWVRAGGAIVVAADYDTTLNGLFGYEVETTGDSEWLNVAPAGSPFRGGPATLPDNDGSSSYRVSTLPAGAVTQYIDSDNDNAGVFTTREGKGTTVALAWDWYHASPAQADGQDGGWRSVLDTAVRTGIKAPVAVAPAPSNAFTLPKASAYSRAAAVKLKIQLPGAGRLTVGSSRKGALKTVTKKVGTSGKAAVWVKPSRSTIKKLKKQLKKKGVASTKIRVKATYTPTGGKPRTVTKVYVFKMKR